MGVQNSMNVRVTLLKPHGLLYTSTTTCINRQRENAWIQMASQPAAMLHYLRRRYNRGYSSYTLLFKPKVTTLRTLRYSITRPGNRRPDRGAVQGSTTWGRSTPAGLLAWDICGLVLFKCQSYPLFLSSTKYRRGF